MEVPPAETGSRPRTSTFSRVIRARPHGRRCSLWGKKSPPYIPSFIYWSVKKRKDEEKEVERFFPSSSSSLPFFFRLPLPSLVLGVQTPTEECFKERWVQSDRDGPERAIL